MIKKILKAIWKFISDGPGPSSLGVMMDSYELCGWDKCPVPERKVKIEEDYSI